MRQGFTESAVEEATLTWLESPGWTVKHGPESAPGGLAAERAEFPKLLFAPVARNLIELFLRREQARRPATWVSEEHTPRQVQKAAVVGAGVMGAGGGCVAGGVDAGDQKRIATPRQALEAGASYLVIGRQITRAEDPRAEALRILEEIG